MDRAAIVNAFLEKDTLLSPKALDILAAAGMPPSLPRKLLLTEQDVQPPVRILKSLTGKPAELRTEDFISFYKSKYTGMAAIIQSRLAKEFISLNRLAGVQGEVHLIGMVKDVQERNGSYVIELEDPTGTVSIVFGGQQHIGLDDVVAVRAVRDGDVLQGKQVLFPDVPLRQPAQGKGKACFLSNLHLDEAPHEDVVQLFAWIEQQDCAYVFVAGETGKPARLDELAGTYLRGKTVFASSSGPAQEYPNLPDAYESKNIIPLSNPAIVELGAVKVLLVNAFSLDMIKKRHLGPSKLILPEDYLMLDIVPDIVHHGGSEPHITNYKAITTATSGSLLGEMKPVIINFETREAGHAR